jgi:hypothetical protein
MNILCPNCQKMVPIADEFAGQQMQCPLCAGTFTAPVLASAAANPTAPIPFASPVASETATGVSSASKGLNQSAPERPRPTPHPETGGSSPPPPPIDYTHRYIIWISPRVVPWIAPVALVLVFFFLFFPWRSVPASVTADIPSQVGWAKIISSPLWIFYFLLYLIALALSVGSLLLTLAVVPAVPQIAHLLPWKSCIVAAAVALAFLFILIEFWTEDLSTAWFRWTVWLHVLALVGLSLEYWLQIRGRDRPLPRVDVVW